MSRRNEESGQALVFAVTALGIFLLGIAGLGVDTGYLRYQKRLQQTAADAAAIAGASNLAYGGITLAAQNAAAANGFTDASSNTVSTCTGTSPTTAPTNPPTVCVQINNPPSTGPHSTDSNYVEALVSVVHPTFFMKLFGTKSEPITARAVATTTTGGVNNGCLYTLGPPNGSVEGVNINGNATLNAPTCGIVDNGNFNTKGNALNVSAGTFGVAGSWMKSGPGGTVTCADQATTDCPASGTPAAGDPFATLTPPCSPCTGGTSWVAGNGPGIYSDISIGPTTVNFSPGVYIINGSAGGGGGNLSISANATVTGTGVMFYFTNGATVSMHGTPLVNLTAPSAANCPACATQYDGILYYQDPNDTSGALITGDGTDTYNGVMYFPKALLTFQGNASIGDVALVVADGLALSGHPTVNLLGSAGLGNATSFIKNAVLVE